jgi:hypothetical protein
VVEPASAIEEEFTGSGFGPTGHKIFASGNAPPNLHRWAIQCRVLDHYNCVGPRRQRSSGHNPDGLAALNRASSHIGPVAGFDLADNFQPGGNRSYVFGAHGVSITGSSIKRGEGTVGLNWFGQDAREGGKQIQGLGFGGSYLGGMVFDDVACLFKWQQASGGGRGHGGMIARGLSVRNNPSGAQAHRNLADLRHE